MPITQFGYAHAATLHIRSMKDGPIIRMHVFDIAVEIIGSYAENGPGIVGAAALASLGIVLPRNHTRGGERQTQPRLRSSDLPLGQIPLVDIERVADPFMNAPILIHERNDADPMPAPESRRDADAPPAFERAPDPPRATGLQEKSKTVVRMKQGK